MKATGIVRNVDELGRIVLPIELRRNLDINEHDPLEIYVEGTCIKCTSRNGKSPVSRFCDAGDFCVLRPQLSSCLEVHPASAAKLCPMS